MPSELDLNWVWNLQCSNKIKFFLLVCSYNKLPCRISRICININEQCNICRREPETISHIFISCPIVYSLWRQLGINTSYFLLSKANWLLYLKEKSPQIPHKHLFWNILFPFTICNIWLIRNSNNINNISNEVTLKWIINQSIEYKLLTERESNWDRKIDLNISWTKPFPGWYKLNIDGAFNKKNATRGIGEIFRNQNGD